MYDPSNVIGEFKDRIWAQPVTEYLTVDVDIICGTVQFETPVSGFKPEGRRDVWQWDEFEDAVRRIKPRWVVVEAPERMLSKANLRRMRGVLSGLSSLGFDAEWEVVSPCYLGAPYTQSRLYIVAYPIGHLDRTGPAFAHAGEARRAVLRDADPNTLAEIWEDYARGSMDPERLDRLPTARVPRRLARPAGSSAGPVIAQWLGHLITLNEEIASAASHHAAR
jgi:DNA (cytosine-5)-methyltransferase 1